jgi:hypothetical protein
VSASTFLVSPHAKQRGLGFFSLPRFIFVNDLCSRMTEGSHNRDFGQVQDLRKGLMTDGTITAKDGHGKRRNDDGDVIGRHETASTVGFVL